MDDQQQQGQFGLMDEQSDKPQKPPSKKEQNEKDPQRESKQAAVKKLLGEIEQDKKRWDPDHTRMKEDIAFCMGFQREEQTNLVHDEYTCNLVLRNVNQKVAALYARNPTAEWQRQKRLDYQLWDGKMESIQPLAAKVAMGVMPMPQEMALIQDYIQGEQERAQVEKVGQTIQTLYQRQIDNHDPDFKLQMKALVRRVCTCGVGFVRVSYVREVNPLTVMEGMGNSLIDQAKMLHMELEKQDKSGAPDTSPRNEKIKMLLNSMQAAVDRPEPYEIQERLQFDFLTATSVIPDRLCRNLKGFVGARRVTIEYLLPLDEVNAYFETEVKPGGEVKLYRGDGKVEEASKVATMEGDMSQLLCCVYEVFDKASKSHCFVMDGYKDYLQEPEELEPCVKGFWPIFSLMFNDVESMPDTKATIYPPSDVFLMRHPQKEWNRTREALRKQRHANAAKYVTQKGWLTDADKDKIENAEDNAVIELEGLPANTTPDKALSPMVHDPIDEKVYDTSPLMQDILFSVGAQDSNIGSPNPKGTATGQSIAEQSRTVGMGSNVDDLDDFLSCLADAGGQLIFLGFSNKTILEEAGPGAVMFGTLQDKVGWLNKVYLRVVAASSGRPNKVMELQNWQLIAPVLQAAGANPQFMVRETIKRVDDRLDPSEAFPLVPQGPPPGMQPQGPPPKGQGPQQRPQPPRGQQGPPPRQGRPGPGRLGPRPQQPLSAPVMSPAQSQLA